MDKELVKESIKEMFKNGELTMEELAQMEKEARANVPLDKNKLVNYLKQWRQDLERKEKVCDIKGSTSKHLYSIQILGFEALIDMIECGYFDMEQKT